MKRRIVKKALKRFIQNNQKYNKLIVKMDNIIYRSAKNKEMHVKIEHWTMIPGSLRAAGEFPSSKELEEQTEQI